MVPTTDFGQRGLVLQSTTGPADLSLVGGLIVVAVGLGLVGFAVYYGRDGYRVYTTDPITVLELPNADGYVEIEGRARELDSEGTFQAPFSGADCLACRYRIEELRSSGKSSHWETIDEGGGWLPFAVEDDTGKARIDPAGATFNLTAEEIRVGSGETPPERVQRYVRNNDSVDAASETIDLKLVELNVGKDRKYVEERLEPGESVHVAGQSRYGAGWDTPSGFVNAVVGDGDATPLCSISDTGERGAAWRLAKPAVWTALIGVVVALFGVGWVLG